MNFQNIQMFCSTAETLTNNSMFYQLTKTCLLIAFFGTLAVFNYTSAKGETNELNDVTSPTNKFIWSMESFQGGIGTNGLSFSLSMNNRNLNGYSSTNYCGVYVSNQSANKFHLWVDCPAVWLKVDLLDSSGQPVEKTEIGKQFGKPFDMAQLHEMLAKRYRQWTSGRSRGTGFEPIVASSGSFPLTGFNLPELFKLKQAGEYSLRVQLPLIQRIGENAANPEIKIVWLPAVTAKIQILPQDVPPQNLLPNDKTNSPAK
jgi:hypothetical protein